MMLTTSDVIETYDFNTHAIQLKDSLILSLHTFITTCEDENISQELTSPGKYDQALLIFGMMFLIKMSSCAKYTQRKSDVFQETVFFQEFKFCIWKIYIIQSYVQMWDLLLQ